MLPVAERQKHRDGGGNLFLKIIFIVLFVVSAYIIALFYHFASGSERGGGLSMIVFVKENDMEQ